jgi:dTDP-4-dehydrorhamnose 3,5-epimerase
MRVTRLRMEDERGFLARLFCAEELGDAGWAGPIAQVNLTRTRKAGTVRGMHYQLPPHAERKLVTCVRGEVWDVALDLRAGSPTFLQWHAQPLSEANDTALLLPEGVAHGFQALSDDAELLYCHSRPFTPEAERGIWPLDPRPAIAWPLPVSAMSDRDRQHPALDDAFRGVDA